MPGLRPYSSSSSFLVAIALGLFSSCGNSDKELADFQNRKVGVEIAKEVRIQYTLGGQKKALLTGPLMYRVQDTVPYIEFPKSIHVDFFDDRDSLESTLDARYAQYKDTYSKVFMRDSVRVINIKGDTLYCDELYWDRSRTGVEFYTEKPVRIRTRTHIIDGVGMEACRDPGRLESGIQGMRTRWD